MGENEEYKKKIFQIINKIENTKILRYIYIIISDIIEDK